MKPVPPVSAMSSPGMGSPHLPGARGKEAYAADPAQLIVSNRIACVGSSTVMHGEPDRRPVRIGPFDPMALTGGDEDEIAGAEAERFGLVLEPEHRRALEQEDPFAKLLVVPEIRR